MYAYAREWEAWARTRNFPFVQGADVRAQWRGAARAARAAKGRNDVGQQREAEAEQERERE